MSEPKVQLLDPQGNINLPGINATGVITASSLDGAGGVVTGLTGNPNLNVGVVTATSFVGDGTGHAAGLTGTPNLNLGLTTATSFVGDAVGKATGLTGTPNLNVGLITASNFVGDVTGDITGNITGNVTGNITGNVTGNVTGIAGSVVQGTNIHVGVVTATTLYGGGSNLTGIAATNFNTQTVAAVGAATTIDLSAGNIITFNQNTDTTVSFANTSEAMDITLIRPGGERNVAISYATGGVEFDGSDWLAIPDDSDFTFGTDDFTIECWYKTNNITGLSDSFDYIFAAGWPVQLAHTNGSSKKITFYMKNSDSGASGSYFINDLNSGTGSITSTTKWYHIAVTRNGSTVRMFLDGVLTDTQTSSDSAPAPGQATTIGRFTTSNSPAYYANGTVSNFRYVKGTALYTSNFLPPTEALTNITNTKLLCCQSTSSTTAATVIPTGSITAGGDPTAAAETIALASASYLTQGSITWPSSIKWNGGSAPTLTDTSNSGEVNQFEMLTRDSGVTWYAWENMKRTFAEKYTLWAWGKNQGGTLGLNQSFVSQQGASSPTQIPGSWTSTVSGNYGATFAVRSDGTLWAWGNNPSGVLGQGLANEGPNSLARTSSPVQIPGDWSGCKFPKYSMGDGDTNGVAVIKSDGTMWVWGNNGSGLLGLNQTSDGSLRYSSPVQLGTDTNWRSFDMAKTSMIATKTDGSLWSWGYLGHYGNLGQNERYHHGQQSGDKKGYSSPTQIGTDTDWSEEIGFSHGGGGAVKTDGTLWMWGYNYYGQLGVNSAAASVYGLSSPTQVPGTDWAKVSRSNNATYAIKTDGSLKGWGDNEYRGLGIPSVTARSSPVSIPGATWSKVWPGRIESPRGLATNGDMYGWGRNVWGSIGNNANDGPDAGVAARTQVPGTWTGMWHGGDLRTFGLKSS